ncbi:hypothetical protein Q9Q94_01490 [Uliginosibacterium sp. 31-16]|nr:hypothetical protein [Uliginosibacterium sp. 31-16]MDP5238181.1 hypothetical protein [Uliginosibacterium sp. 31-16]
MWSKNYTTRRLTLSFTHTRFKRRKKLALFEAHVLLQQISKILQTLPVTRFNSQQIIAQGTMLIVQAQGEAGTALHHGRRQALLFYPKMRKDLLRALHHLRMQDFNIISLHKNAACERQRGVVLTRQRHQFSATFH